MRVQVYSDPALFVEHVERLLLRDELQHSAMLGLIPILEAMPEQHPSSLFLATVTLGDSGESIGGMLLIALQYSAWHGMHIVRVTNEVDLYEQGMETLVRSLQEKKVSMEAVIADSITARSFANAALETEDWVQRVSHSQTRDVLVLKKLKNNKNLAPGKLVVVDPAEAETYTDKFYSLLTERWGEFSPINTQCREALRDTASHGWLLAHVYRDHMVAFCMVRQVSSTKARFTTCATPRPYRGRGFGKALLCNAIKHLRKQHGVKEFMLFQEEDDPARELYTTIGFSDQATAHIYEVLLTAAVAANKRVSLAQGTPERQRTSFARSPSYSRPSTANARASKSSFDANPLLSKGMRAWVSELPEEEQPADADSERIPAPAAIVHADDDDDDGDDDDGGRGGNGQVKTGSAEVEVGVAEKGTQRSGAAAHSEQQSESDETMREEQDKDEEGEEEEEQGHTDADEEAQAQQQRQEKEEEEKKEEGEKKEEEEKADGQAVVEGSAGAHDDTTKADDGGNGTPEAATGAPPPLAPSMDAGAGDAGEEPAGANLQHGNYVSVTELLTPVSNF